MPMFLPRCEPDHITWSNVFDGTTPALDPTTGSRHDQGLAQRMAVPCGPSAGLEGDTGTTHACWIGGLKQGVKTDRAGKIVGRPFPGRLRATSFDIHFLAFSTLENVLIS